MTRKLKPRVYNLTKYRVTLVDFNDNYDWCDFDFECWAEDEDHAREQAQNAYPKDDIYRVRVVP